MFYIFGFVVVKKGDVMIVKGLFCEVIDILFIYFEVVSCVFCVLENNVMN